jgi:putative addiction module killer protein
VGEPISREVVVYRDPKGRAPAREWLLGLTDAVVRAAVLIRIRRLQLGNAGDSKPVGAVVHERRIHKVAGLRLYYGLDGRTLVVLLCGGTKRTQSRDIARAKRLRAAYRRKKTYESAHTV